MNNFKELEKIQEEQYRNNLLKVKSNINGNLDIFSSITNVVELFFTKFIALLVDMAGGSSDNENKNEN
ncbi:MAG: hypothetical protein HKN09_09070 [Saprospiraceae bacterium]|nr:hypothetical protein [Saprospiraceae bacterium]